MIARFLQTRPRIDEALSALDKKAVNAGREKLMASLLRDEASGAGADPWTSVALR